MVGYFSYDLGNRFENIQCRQKNHLGLPGYSFGFYDTVICVDHYKNEILVNSTGLPERRMLSRKKRAQERLKEIGSRLERYCKKGENGGEGYQGLHGKKPLSQEIGIIDQRKGAKDLRQCSTATGRTLVAPLPPCRRAGHRPAVGDGL